jgi:type IX secretion system PorP/SprF family membrane protein
MKKRYLILLIFLYAFSSNAQQDPQYTQYMYNMNVINPAYAGSSEGLGVGILYRSQWEGLDGAPETSTINIHTPIGNNVGLGMSVISDQIGPVKETNAYIDFSYTLNLAKENRLAFGLKAGVTSHDIGLVDLTLIDLNDPFFANDISEMTPNIGAGMYFYKPNKYYVSVSMPNILNSVHLDADDYNIGSETQHLFAATGYVFDLSNDFKLKPHAFLKYTSESPTSLDLNANLFMYDIVELGVGYRLDAAMTAMVNFRVSPSCRIGYSYDSVQSELNFIAKSSHEVFINFDLNFNTKVSKSPRYF